MDETTALLEKQYQLEKEYAARIKESEPFSEERALVTREAYQRVNELIEKRNQGQNAFGFQQRYLEMIRPFLKEGDLFFEAGVGTGALIREVSKIPGVTVTGCDPFLDPQFVHETAGLQLMEDSLYHSLLRLEDGSVDCFYWNDVMEHICPDEITETIGLLYRKMKSGGTVLTITPNALTGPHDITALADKKEKTARGLHLKEYTYTEVKTIFQISGFVTKGHFIRWKKDVFSTHFCRLYDVQRNILERIMKAIPCRLLSRCAVYHYDLNVSVMLKP